VACPIENILASCEKCEDLEALAEACKIKMEEKVQTKILCPFVEKSLERPFSVDPWDSKTLQDISYWIKRMMKKFGRVEVCPAIKCKWRKGPYCIKGEKYK